MRSKNLGMRPSGTTSLTGRVDSPRQNELSSLRGLHTPYITEMFQIKGCNNEDTMTLRSDSNKNFKTPKPKLNMFKNSLSYSGTLIWNSIPLEIRNANTIGDFV